MMTDAERMRIEAMAERGHRAVAIGRAINRKTATVRWYLYTIGKVAPSRVPYPPTCMRNGRLVHRFSRDEDAVLLSMRRRGDKCEAIANECNRRFETNRTASSVHARLVIIAREEP